MLVSLVGTARRSIFSHCFLTLGNRPRIESINLLSKKSFRLNHRIKLSDSVESTPSSVIAFSLSAPKLASCNRKVALKSLTRSHPADLRPSKA